MTQVSHLVFEGGGNRCFWQLGFMAAAGPTLQPRAVAAVSAGAAMACAYAAGRVDDTVQAVGAAFAANPRNFYTRDLLSGAYPFPHEAIYRQAVARAATGDALDRLRSGVDIQIALARPPPALGTRPAAAVGAVALAFGAAMNRARRQPAPVRLARLGYVREWRAVRECQTTDELVDLVLASSATPPFVHSLHFRGRRVLDGRFTGDLPPFPPLEDGDCALVLLPQHRPGAATTCTPGVQTIRPSSPLAATAWDYTDADAVRQTFDLGRADGERWLRSGGIADTKPFVAAQPDRGSDEEPGR